MNNFFSRSFSVEGIVLNRTNLLVNGNGLNHYYFGSFDLQVRYSEEGPGGFIFIWLEIGIFIIQNKLALFSDFFDQETDLIFSDKVEFCSMELFERITETEILDLVRKKLKKEDFIFKVDFPL